jgi:hypothetical protein
VVERLRAADLDRNSPQEAQNLMAQLQSGTRGEG